MIVFLVWQSDEKYASYEEVFMIFFFFLHTITPAKAVTFCLRRSCWRRWFDSDSLLPSLSSPGWGALWTYSSWRREKLKCEAMWEVEQSLQNRPTKGHISANKCITVSTCCVSLQKSVFIVNARIKILSKGDICVFPFFHVSFTS